MFLKIVLEMSDIKLCTYLYLSKLVRFYVHLFFLTLFFKSH